MLASIFKLFILSTFFSALTRDFTFVPLASIVVFFLSRFSGKSMFISIPDIISFVLFSILIVPSKFSPTIISLFSISICALICSSSYILNFLASCNIFLFETFKTLLLLS